MLSACKNKRRQIIRYRATVTAFRNLKESNTLPKMKGGCYKSTGTSYNYDKVGWLFRNKIINMIFLFALFQPFN